MESKIDYKTLLDFSEGKYSWKDYLMVKQWFVDSDDFIKIKGHLYEQWKNQTELQQPDTGSLAHLFEKIHYQILLEKTLKEKKNNIWNFYRQVAAILLIPILLFSILFYFFSKKPQAQAESWAILRAPEGARVEFFLPDGSSGWLNSGSTLKYPVIFGKQRKVELTGEGYFDIAHRRNSHFYINVPDLEVKVVGTKFNISAYPADNFTEVVLKKGKVDIRGKTGIFNYSMFPDEKLTFNHTTRSIEVKKIESDLYTSWKDGYLILDNEPLEQAVGRIERWYNTEIAVQDETLKNYRFKATFRDEPLEEVLRLLALTTPIKYVIEKREIDQKGVYMRKKVTLKLK